MAILNNTWFPTEVPPKPNGHYAHIVMLRVTESYALFQTDGELNTARVRSGVAHDGLMTRIEIFKRKQTTPERLTGRELLRRYGFLSDHPQPIGESPWTIRKSPSATTMWPSVECLTVLAMALPSVIRGRRSPNHC
jgi:CRISPR type I-D-associated protein Csc2